MTVTPKRKLIEVALPLEAINRESVREKSIRHGHPSTLHLWWARRPLAAARAVLFAQLVDDPSSHPEEFPTEEAQKVERERLHRIIERLVVWENIRDEKLLAEAHAEILKSTNGNPPAILDPFAGGGSIPLEAQRLGLEAHASDLNPVAVLINKALIEIPPKFRDQAPTFPSLAESQTIGWKGAQGLAADVKAYGAWMSAEAERRIGHLYPKATLADGSKATVIAWVWARTVICPNPACAVETPLVRSWWVSKKVVQPIFIKPTVTSDKSHPSGHRVRFEVANLDVNNTAPVVDGTVTRRGGTCVACGAGFPLSYIRARGVADGLGQVLLATVAQSGRRRTFVAADPEQEMAANRPRPVGVPDGLLGHYPRDIKAPIYGLKTFADLFTNRQLTALVTLSELVGEARGMALRDAQSSGMDQGGRLEDGGIGAAAYADAVATYLGLAVSRLSDIANALCSWENTKTQVRHLFTRQAIPMLWDYAEAPPFGKAAGSFEVSLGSIVKSIVDVGGPVAHAIQADAASREYAGMVVCTDPPYYDNIGYSDLSDFFYVWLRRCLRQEYPKLLSTVLVPKVEELVANAYRHNGKEGAKDFFEAGFRQVFSRARQTASNDYPVTVWYAFKQSDATDEGTTSSGWETLLDGMIGGGWSITATWPNRSEMPNRMMANGMNALASSIVLALRPRRSDSPITDRRGLIAALQSELPQALRSLQLGAIAPVDLPQAAIGPGMAVFSRYASVIEADGSPMTVRSALARINEILDEVLNEQEGDFDSATRFAIAWYRLHGYVTGPYGDAEAIAVQRAASVAAMERQGILRARAGKVTLLRPESLPTDYDVLADAQTSAWEALHHVRRLLESEGVEAAGVFLAAAVSRPDGVIEMDLVKELAFLLFSIAEKNGWTKDALAFNTLATSWPDIVDASRASRAPSTSQSAFDFDENE